MIAMTTRSSRRVNPRVLLKIGFDSEFLMIGGMFNESDVGLRVFFLGNDLLVARIQCKHILELGVQLFPRVYSLS